MIDTQSLKNKILDLAVRGKLVNQQLSDESAHELVARTSYELNETKFDFSCDKSDLPFEIPNNWCWCRLSDIGNTNIGLTYHPEDINDYGTIVIRSSNIVNGKMDYKDLVRISCHIKDNQYLYNNDIVICARNGSKALVGKCAIFSELSSKIAFGAFMAVFRTQFYKYVYYYFQTAAFRRYFSNDDTKQINQVTQNILKNALIPVPPMQEQMRITETIESILKELEIIDDLQAKYAADAEILKSKLIDAAIQGKFTEQLPSDGTAEELYRQIQEEKKALIESGKIKKEKPLKEIEEDEIPFEIPESWKWCRIKDIGITVTGSTPPKKQPEYYGGNYPFYKPADLDKGEHISTASEYLTEAGKEVARQFEKGTILVCCIGSIGKCAVIDEDGTANQQINALTPILCNSDYLLYCISSDFFKTQLQQESRATTVSIIKKSKFDTCILPIPPLGEQKRIVERVEELLDCCK